MSNHEHLTKELELMDEGERQHAANWLWKHHRVCAQKLKEFVPAEMLLELLPPGTMVKVLNDVDHDGLVIGGLGMVMRRDYNLDTMYPYKIAAETLNGDFEDLWVRVDQIAPM